MNKTREYWSALDEIKFLKKAEPKSMNRLQFLQNYKEASHHRHDWTGIKKEEVFKFVNKEIKTLQKEKDAYGFNY